MLSKPHDFMLLVCKDHKVTKFARLHETFFAWCMASLCDGTLHAACIQGCKLLLVVLRLTTK